MNLAADLEADETWEAELSDLVGKLDRLVPRTGAHLTLPADAEGRTTIGNRLGYLRLGVELLSAGLHPWPGSEAEPARIEPDLGYLLGPGSVGPFQLCEIDEAIGSRPPARTRLGFLAQLAAGVAVVVAILLAFIALALALRWLFS